MNRKGFLWQEDAQAAETKARETYARADLPVDGSLAAELEAWLDERELDVQEITLSNYRDIVRCYIVPHWGSRQIYTLTKRSIHDLYKTLLTPGQQARWSAVPDHRAHAAPRPDEGVEGPAHRHRRGG